MIGVALELLVGFTNLALKMFGKCGVGLTEAFGGP
jgi:hypothetical protein